MKTSRKALARKRRAGRARWKSVERRVAERLTGILSDIGMSRLERIPVLGRTGPDITINESRLVIDVKSRQRIPKRLFAEERLLARYEGGLIGFRLDELLSFDRNEPYLKQKPWRLLQEWYDWMQVWTQEHEPDGVSCIILHRPGMPIGDATMVIHKNNVRRLLCQTQQS